MRSMLKLFVIVTLGAAGLVDAQKRVNEYDDW